LERSIEVGIGNLELLDRFVSKIHFVHFQLAITSSRIFFSKSQFHMLEIQGVGIYCDRFNYLKGKGPKGFCNWNQHHHSQKGRKW